MKKKVKILFCMAFMLISFAAKSEKSVVWLEDRHDFGIFNEEDGNQTCIMRFVNNSDKPVAIISARASCGCTQPEYSKEAFAPGDTAEIKITYIPAGRPGRFEKIITVLTTDSQSKHRLTIKGLVIGSEKTVSAHFPYDAGQLRMKRDMVVYDYVTKGKSKSEFLDVYNVSKDTIYPTWENLPDYVTVSAASKAVPPGDYSSFVLNFNTMRCNEYGLVKNVVTLYPNGKNGSEPVKIELFATVVEDFSDMTETQRMKAPVVSVSPERLNLSTGMGLNGYSGKVTVTNTGQNELIIRRVYALDPAINIKCEKKKVKSGKSVDIEVSLNTFGFQSEVLNTLIYIVTNYPDNPIMEYRVVGDISQ